MLIAAQSEAQQLRAEARTCSLLSLIRVTNTAISCWLYVLHITPETLRSVQTTVNSDYSPDDTDKWLTWQWNERQWVNARKLIGFNRQPLRQKCDIGWHSFMEKLATKFLIHTVKLKRLEIILRNATINNCQPSCLQTVASTSATFSLSSTDRFDQSATSCSARQSMIGWGRNQATADSAFTAFR